MEEEKKMEKDVAQVVIHKIITDLIQVWDEIENGNGVFAQEEAVDDQATLSWNRNDVKNSPNNEFSNNFTAGVKNEEDDAGDNIFTNHRTFETWDDQANNFCNDSQKKEWLQIDRL